MPSLTPTHLRRIGEVIRTRPVHNRTLVAEPRDGDLQSPDTRVCFIAAVGVVSRADAPDEAEENRVHNEAYDLIATRISERPSGGYGLAAYFETYGPEACGQLCAALAEEMEDAHA